MAVTIETTTLPNVRAALAAKYGSISRYCAKRQISYTTLANLLKGNGSVSKNLDIVKKVNADVGSDMSVWGHQ